jgi:hypothetical protein
MKGTTHENNDDLSYSHPSEDEESVDFSVGESKMSFTQGEEQRDEVKEVEEMARRETLDVRVWRLLVLLAFVLTSVMVSTGTYVILQDKQEDDFVNSVSFKVSLARRLRYNG